MKVPPSPLPAVDLERATMLLNDLLGAAQADARPGDASHVPPRQKRSSDLL
jgi:hypothetical protein